MRKILLTLVCLVSTLAAFADGTEIDGICYSLNRGSKEANVCCYSNSNNYADNAQFYTGDIVIPASVIYEGEEYHVTAINSHAFYNCNNLISVSLPEGVKSIGQNAFDKCTSLKTINLPESLERLEVQAFQYCSSLEELEIPANATGLEQYAFGFCTALKEVEFSNGATYLSGSAFQGCSSLESVILPESLISIGESAFSGCKKLHEIVLPENLRSMGNNAFYGCSSLESCSLSSALTEIPKSAFFYCTNLSEITIPESVTSIGEDAFANCSFLEDITIKGNQVSIGNRAFANVPSACITFESTEIGTIAPGAFYNSNFTFVVPAEAVAAYRAAWPDYQFQIVPDGYTDFIVEVEARDNSSHVMDNVVCLSEMNYTNLEDALLDVVKLKVTGSINSYDIMVMRNKMLNLQELDLSEADIVAHPTYQYYEGYRTENEVLGPYAFYNLPRLRKVILPNSITSIESYAFSICLGLKEVVFGNNIERIGNHAFYGCSRLKSLVLPEKLETIGSNAFQSCSNLQSVEFPPHLKTISSYAFSSCSKLESVMLPTSLQRIENYAFQGCSNLKEVRIPSSISYIGDQAFNTSSITDIYTWTIQPTNISQNTFHADLYTQATLHVPETAQKLYWWDTQWSQFQTIRNFNAPYEYFYLKDKDLEIDAETPRLEGEYDEELAEYKYPDADLLPGSGLIVEGDESQDLGEVTLGSDGSGNASSIIGGNSATETSGANVNIENLKIQIEISKGRWYFFAFPFDIAFESIHFNGQFVWRYYDGEERALGGSGTWKNQSGQLNRGQGYIFQASKAGTLTLSIPNASIGGDDHMIALESHAASNPQDASWNLVGNPFTSYYELTDLGYDAPITIWNGSTYEAYNPQDDQLTLYPYQAFFVQKPSDTEGVGFSADKRETKNQQEMAEARNAVAERRMARAKANVKRLLVNLEVSDGETTDKTRVVFNEQRSAEYEMECDAAKFISTDAPQIYTQDAQGTKYAINERPEADGIVKLGFYTTRGGAFSIGATRLDCGMLLKDLKLGITHDLSKGAYSFSAEKGTTENRFLLKKAADESDAIESIASLQPATYYTTDGKQMSEGQKGVVIVKRGNKAQKMPKK